MEQGRVLFTLMAWFLESEDERLLHYVRGLLRALHGLSRVEGQMRLFDSRFHVAQPFTDVSPMILVEPLMKYYQVTGDSDALEFCEGIVNWAVHPDTLCRRPVPLQRMAALTGGRPGGNRAFRRDHRGRCPA